MFIVLFSLCLGGTHVVVRELADAKWMKLVVCSHKQSIRHPKKDAHRCARIVYMGLVVDSGGQEIPVE